MFKGMLSLQFCLEYVKMIIIHIFCQVSVVVYLFYNITSGLISSYLSINVCITIIPLHLMWIGHLQHHKSLFKIVYKNDFLNRFIAAIAFCNVFLADVILNCFQLSSVRDIIKSFDRIWIKLNVVSIVWSFFLSLSRIFQFYRDLLTF